MTQTQNDVNETTQAPKGVERFFQLDLHIISDNYANQRSSLPVLNSLGYGSITQIEGSTLPSVLDILLGRASAIKDQEGKEMTPSYGVALIEMYENKPDFEKLAKEADAGDAESKRAYNRAKPGESLVELAESIRLDGQDQPVVVTHAKDNPTKWSVIAGTRRTIVAAYLHAKYGMPAEVEAKFIEVKDEEEAFRRSFNENFRRAKMNPVDEGRCLLAAWKASGEKKLRPFCEKWNLDYQITRNRTELLDVAKFNVTKEVVKKDNEGKEYKETVIVKTGAELLDEVASGKTGLVKVSQWLAEQKQIKKGKKAAGSIDDPAPKQDTRKRAPTLAEWEKVYNSGEVTPNVTKVPDEHVRKYLAEMFGWEYKTLKALQAEAKAAAAAEAQTEETATTTEHKDETPAPKKRKRRKKGSVGNEPETPAATTAE